MLGDAMADAAARMADMLRYASALDASEAPEPLRGPHWQRSIPRYAVAVEGRLAVTVPDWTTAERCACLWNGLGRREVAIWEVTPDGRHQAESRHPEGWTDQGTRPAAGAEA